VKAVVFDMDGVLVESEQASSEAWRTALAGFGFHIDDANVDGFVGTTDRALAEFFSARVGEEPSIVLKAAEREMRRQAAGGLVAFPDALSALDRLVIPAAVASNSDRWRLDLVLGAAGIRDRFSVSVAGDEVPSPKPTPDIYLRAAALLNVDAGDCLVIEDSPTGLTAARAAGMKVVAVRRGYFEDDELALADEIVDSVTSSTLLGPLAFRRS
jgi:HAD superfamily hydrolase (TIGR01509 family)